MSDLPESGIISTDPDALVVGGYELSGGAVDGARVVGVTVNRRDELPFAWFLAPQVAAKLYDCLGQFLDAEEKRQRELDGGETEAGE